MELKAATFIQTNVAKSSATDTKKSDKVVAQNTITQDKQQKTRTIESGYAHVIASMRTSNIRGKAIKRMEDRHDNYAQLGMLSVNAIAANGPKSVAVELSTIRRDTITMMNKLPIEVNIKVADEIRHMIKLNQFPTDVEEINQTIKEITASVADF